MTHVRVCHVPGRVKGGVAFVLGRVEAGVASCKRRRVIEGMNICSKFRDLVSSMKLLLERVELQKYKRKFEGKVI
jgi:hypothetical protein